MTPDILPEGIDPGWVFIYPDTGPRASVSNIVVVDSKDESGTVYATVTFFVGHALPEMTRGEKDSPFYGCVPVQLKDLEEYASILAELSNTGVRHVYHQYIPRGNKGPTPTPISEAIAEVRDRF